MVSEEEILELNLTKGCMELNDRENHIKLSSRLKKTHGTVKMMPGGSVANSLYTLSQFRADVSFVGRVSDDTTGDAFINSLEDTGVRVNINQVDNGITGECLVLITPDHERTMYTHLGVSSELNVNDIKDSNVLHDSPFCKLSGVFYSNAPKNCGDLIFSNPAEIQHFINSSEVNKYNSYNCSKYKITPEDNMLVIFPSFLKREVAINTSSSKRISFSFSLM